MLFPHIIRNKQAIKFGSNFKSLPNLFLEPHFKAQITFGDNIVLNRSCYITSVSSITIGNNCLFGPNVFITDHDHGFYDRDSILANQNIPPTFRTLSSAPITIGTNCWFGVNTVILKGVHIGDNVVVGSNSVVTGNIPSNCVVAGSPAKIIKSI